MPELEVAITEVLTFVLVLCGICAKYIKMNRIRKETGLAPGALRALYGCFTGALYAVQIETNSARDPYTA